MYVYTSTCQRQNCDILALPKSTVTVNRISLNNPITLSNSIIHTSIGVKSPAFPSMIEREVGTMVTRAPVG